MTYNWKSIDSNYSNSLSSFEGASGELTAAVDVPTNAITGTLGMSSDKYLTLVDGGRLNLGSSALTVYSPSNIDAPSDMKIVTGSGTLKFSGQGGVVHMGWWGDDVAALQAAIDSLENVGGGVVMLPETTLYLSASQTISCTSNIILRGLGHSTVIASENLARSNPLLKIDEESNILIENIRFDGNGYTGDYGHIEVTGDCDNITIQNCFFEDGYSGVWFKPGTNKTISNITLFNNTLDGLAIPLFFGNEGTSPTTGESTKQIKILSNTIRNATIESSTDQGMGIRMYQSTTDVLIENNMILNNAANGIELFISGERIVILGNTIAGNTKNGVYIKRDSTTDSNWETAKQLLISANIIQGNSENGIEIETTSDFRPYLINISSNDIFGN